MKLSEMQAKKSGLPEGFSGARAKWNEIGQVFQIRKACILERPAVGTDGSPMVYSQGPREGEPILDRQLALAIRTKDGRDWVVRTNSRRLVSLFSGDLDRKADWTNVFGDDVYMVDAPEGWLKFVPFKYEYKNGQKGDIADLEEAGE